MNNKRQARIAQQEFILYSSSSSSSRSLFKKAFVKWPPPSFACHNDRRIWTRYQGSSSNMIETPSGTRSPWRSSNWTSAWFLIQAIGSKTCGSRAEVCRSIVDLLYSLLVAVHALSRTLDTEYTRHFFLASLYSPTILLAPSWTPPWRRHPFSLE